MSGKYLTVELLLQAESWITSVGVQRLRELATQRKRFGQPRVFLLKMKGLVINNKVPETEN